jgi:hypothetical protein
MKNIKSFRNFGFLSEEAEIMRAENRQKLSHDELYINTLSVISICERMKFEFNFQKDSQQDLLISILTNLLLNTADSVIILSEYRIDHNAMSLVRDLADILGVLLNITAPDDFWKLFLLTDNLTRLKWLNQEESSKKEVQKAKNNCQKDLDDNKKLIYKYAISKPEKIKSNQAELKNIFKTENLFKRVKEERAYNDIFRFCSEYTHSDIRSFDHFIKINKTTNTVDIDRFADSSLIKISLSFTMICLFKGFIKVAEFKKLDTKNELYSKLLALREYYNKTTRELRKKEELGVHKI